MGGTKYFDTIERAQAAQRPASEMPAFDLSRLKAKGFGAKLVSRLLENPRWILALLRRFRPIAKLGPVYLVTRNDDVRDVLERQDEFRTPFGPEMTEMAGGANFILGMQDGAAYR